MESIVAVPKSSLIESYLKSHRGFFVLFAFWFLVGCGTTGNKQIMNPNFSETLQVGVTTKDEVRALLGEPQHYGEIVSQTPAPAHWSVWDKVKSQGAFPGQTQTLAVWRYMGTERSLNVAAFIPLVDIAAGRQTVLTKWVDCYFDANDLLVKTDVHSNTNEKMAPVGTLLLGAVAIGAAAGAAASPYRGYGYRGYPGGRAVVNTIPTAGGGSWTTIKWYK